MAKKTTIKLTSRKRRPAQSFSEEISKNLQERLKDRSKDQDVTTKAPSTDAAQPGPPVQEWQTIDIIRIMPWIAL
jgi:recombinational DNA repair protein RecT